MKIAVINGPNLNMLGIRKKTHYGALTLKEIEAALSREAKKLQIELIFFQSNSQGAIIDFIQQTREKISGILINGGAYSHYSYAIRDALIDTQLPVVTVHLSNIYAREEEFRHKDILSDIAVGGIYGFKENSYLLGLQALATYLMSNQYQSSNDKAK